ncbi:basic endochitinase-like [Tasmannia lanceolata]|uniref:basic endochitinase-like n=1 Tax=Tasmannia lanceolata TaxID=3420 RepID=UPI0040638F26
MVIPAGDGGGGFEEEEQGGGGRAELRLEMVVGANRISGENDVGFRGGCGWNGVEMSLRHRNGFLRRWKDGGCRIWVGEGRIPVVMGRGFGGLGDGRRWWEYWWGLMEVADGGGIIDGVDYFLQKQGKNPVDYCVASAEFPCAYGKKYHGRGPIQISYNYNYGPAGKAIGANLLANPDLVSTDATVSFKTAIWYWMTSKSQKPSCHDAITSRWTPSNEDKTAGRLPGFGVSTNIINGGLECGKGNNVAVANRIGFYKRYCDILGVSYGTNLDCYNQKPFA